MYLDFDFEKMERLLNSFYKISSVRYCLMDHCSNIMCVSSEHCSFCARMNATREGHARCEQCDADAVDRAKNTKSGHLIYRCHAGLIEAVIPVRQHGDILAYIMFGQMVDSQNLEEEWKRTRSLIDWMPDADSYRDAFMQVKRMDDKMIEGCADILEACSSYIWMDGMIKSAFMSDEQLLNHYIAEHYAEPLTLDSIAKALSMSKTKLCSVAAKQETTVMTMVNTRRMEEAKRMFRHRSDRVAEIAYLVGIRDYNYFTKLFKAYTGETPRAYQKRCRNKVAKLPEE
jgi:AraC-like DNA-binding protein